MTGSKREAMRMWLASTGTAGMLMFALLVTFAIAPSSVLAQSAEELDQRLLRVEKVLDQSLLRLAQRVEALQQEIRVLRGELETANNKIEVQQKRNRDLYRDTDQRLVELETKIETVGQPLGPDGLPLDGTEPGLLLDETASPGGDAEPSDTEPGDADSGNADETQSDNSANDPQSPGVFVARGGANAGQNSAPVAGSSSRRAATQAEKASYIEAYDLLSRGKNNEAAEAFGNFLAEYPDGPYSDNAWYWRGEAKYAKREFDSALADFEKVVGSFPTSPKVPDARLKIGYSLYEQGQFEQARTMLTAVQNDYPGRSASVLARKRLQQMDREEQ